MGEGVLVTRCIQDGFLLNFEVTETGSLPKNRRLTFQDTLHLHKYLVPYLMTTSTIQISHLIHMKMYINKLMKNQSKECLRVENLRVFCVLWFDCTWHLIPNCNSEKNLPLFWKISPIFIQLCVSVKKNNSKIICFPDKM